MQNERIRSDNLLNSVNGKVYNKTIVFVLLMANFTLAVDFSVLNVALPTIGKDVGFSLEHLQWIATVYSLCAAGFTLFFGRIADLFGRKRLFLIGITLLGLSSLAGGLAEEPVLLLIARASQGLATAIVTPAALSLMTTSFPEGPQRDRVLGWNGALMAAGFTTGAILGGILTSVLSWRWAFFINVFVAIAVILIAPFVLKESKLNYRPKVDFLGAITVTAGLLAIVYGFTTAGTTSWSDRSAWGSLIIGAVLLLMFWFTEKYTPQPLVPISILKQGNIVWGNFTGLLAFITETSLVFLLTLYLQDVLGYTPLSAGLSLTALGVGTIIGGVIGPRIINLIGAKHAIIVAFVVQAAATFPLVFLNVGSGWLILLLVVTFIGGVANLAAIVGFMVTATSGLPDHEQGLATGLATMSQQIGITMGIPIMSAIATARMNILGHQTKMTILSGISLAIVINTALCILTALLIALFLRSKSQDN
ncbi:MFS transporter [Sporolactobacillus pectinivorans]|uniref:MFS transporter n=1 Tax=Sporolactobacillus pectinivorans TaxID=1591408 RepID=UPI000C266F11|nr:MFS transporter [Sporolactobacillus pectinivorans]